MNIWLLISSLLFSSTNSVIFWASGSHSLLAGGDTEKLALVMHCRNEASTSERLHCYDLVFPPSHDAKISPIEAGPAWQRAMEQETARIDHSTSFLVKEGTGDNPMVVITTPALGMTPPRPVLILSCIDNITRLQVALTRPQKESSVRLTIDNDRFDVQWFLRENGYLLESSRGLSGIDDIKRLMSSETLTIDGTNSTFPHLTFNISQLTQALKPLRNACHW